MSFLRRPVYLVLFFAMPLGGYAATEVLEPKFPTIPSSYTVLSSGKLIAQAKVNFPSYVIRNTSGYKVTSPEGNEFIVDNIVQPKCAFYATYIATDDNGFLGVNNTSPVISNVYIGEVNFDKCQ